MLTHADKLFSDNQYLPAYNSYMNCATTEMEHIPLCIYAFLGAAASKAKLDDFEEVWKLTVQSKNVGLRFLINGQSEIDHLSPIGEWIRSFAIIPDGITGRKEETVLDQLILLRKYLIKIKDKLKTRFLESSEAVSWVAFLEAEFSRFFPDKTKRTFTECLRSTTPCPVHPILYPLALTTYYFDRLTSTNIKDKPSTYDPGDLFTENFFVYHCERYAMDQVEAAQNANDMVNILIKQGVDFSNYLKGFSEALNRYKDSGAFNSILLPFLEQHVPVAIRPPKINAVLYGKLGKTEEQLLTFIESMNEANKDKYSYHSEHPFLKDAISHMRLLFSERSDDLRIENGYCIAEWFADKRSFGEVTLSIPELSNICKIHDKVLNAMGLQPSNSIAKNNIHPFVYINRAMHSVLESKMTEADRRLEKKEKTAKLQLLAQEKRLKDEVALREREKRIIETAPASLEKLSKTDREILRLLYIDESQSQQQLHNKTNFKPDWITHSLSKLLNLGLVVQDQFNYKLQEKIVPLIPEVLNKPKTNDVQHLQISSIIHSASLSSLEEITPKNRRTYSHYTDEYILWLKTVPYKEVYLKTGHWQGVRERMLFKFQNKCAMCSSSENLNVHHNKMGYKNRGCELDTDVVVVCNMCHRLYHNRLSNDDNKKL